MFFYGKFLLDQAFIFETPPMSTESFVNSFDSSTTTATPMASPIPEKPVHIPKYLELVYNENDALPPPPSELSESDNNKMKTPYEIPLNLNNDTTINSNKVENNNSHLSNHHRNNVPVGSSNCSSISGDEGSLQALLGQAPPPPTNNPT